MPSLSYQIVGLSIIWGNIGTAWEFGKCTKDTLEVWINENVQFLSGEEL